MRRTTSRPWQWQPKATPHANFHWHLDMFRSLATERFSTLPEAPRCASHQYMVEPSPTRSKQNRIPEPKQSIFQHCGLIHHPMRLPTKRHGSIGMVLWHGQQRPDWTGYPRRRPATWTGCGYDVCFASAVRMILFAWPSQTGLDGLHPTVKDLDLLRLRRIFFAGGVRHSRLHSRTGSALPPEKPPTHDVCACARIAAGTLPQKDTALTLQAHSATSSWRTPHMQP